MSDTYLTPAGGRTRWGRFTLALGVSTALATGLMLMIADGAFPANFTVSSQQFKVSADTLDGEGFVQYGFIDERDNGPQPVAVSAMRHAELTNLCQSVLTSLPVVGDVSLRLTAGTGDEPVEADNIFIDMTQLDGDAVFTNIEIGRDASTLDKGPPNAQGLPDAFGQQSDRIHIDNLQQVAVATTASTFRLSDLSLRVTTGQDECF